MMRAYHNSNCLISLYQWGKPVETGHQRLHPQAYAGRAWGVRITLPPSHTPYQRPTSLDRFTSSRIPSVGYLPVPRWSRQHPKNSTSYVLFPVPYGFTRTTWCPPSWGPRLFGPHSRSDVHFRRVGRVGKILLLSLVATPAWQDRCRR